MHVNVKYYYIYADDDIQAHDLICAVDVCVCLSVEYKFRILIYEEYTYKIVI